MSAGHGSRENVAKVLDTKGIFTYVTAFLLFVVQVSAAMASALPWWSTGKAGKILGANEAQDCNIGLWSFDITVLQQTTQGAVPTKFEMTWDDYCTALGRLGSGTMNGGELDEPAECPFIKTARAMAIVVIVFATVSILFVIVSRFTTPLLLVAGAFGSILTTVFAFVAIGMGGLVGTAGIGAIGAMSIGASFVCGAASVVSCFYTAAQAMRPEDHDEFDRGPREQRAKQAREKAAAESAELEEHMAASRRSGSKSEGSSRGDAPKKRNLPHLKKVLFWNKDKALHDDNEEIPTSLLEKAFREIDQDGGGNIDTSELVEALRICGLNASTSASETILKEIDKNASGDVDIHEFVEFFRHIEELSHFQKKNQRRAQFLALVCNGCFIFHVIGVCALLIVVVRMDPEADPDNYSLTRTLLMVASVFLAMLFSVVIAIPAIKITIGPHWAVWEAHYEAEAANRGKKKVPQNQGPDEATLRSAAWAAGRPAPGPVAGLPGPVAVNTAMYGASWRPSRARGLGTEDVLDASGNQTGMLGNTIMTQGSSASTGIILDKDGGFERYDPSSYWQAQRMAREKNAPRSFNAMQVHNISRPQEDVRQAAIETQMLALPGMSQSNAFNAQMV